MSNIEMFEELLILEEDSLDEACKTQAELFRMVGNELVNAIDNRDRLEHNLDILSARKDELIRRKASDTNEKITETAIKNKIIMDKEVIALTNEYLDAQKEVNNFSNLRDSYIQRSKMIEEMASFIKNNTFGEFVIKASNRISSIEKYEDLRKKTSLKRKNKD